jgi:hypothetical protein
MQAHTEYDLILPAHHVAEEEARIERLKQLVERMEQAGNLEATARTSQMIAGWDCAAKRRHRADVCSMV